MSKKSRILTLFHRLPPRELPPAFPLGPFELFPGPKPEFEELPKLDELLELEEDEVSGLYSL